MCVWGVLDTAPIPNSPTFPPVSIPVPFPFGTPPFLPFHWMVHGVDSGLNPSVGPRTIHTRRCRGKAEAHTRRRKHAARRNVSHEAPRGVQIQAGTREEGRWVECIGTRRGEDVDGGLAADGGRVETRTRRTSAGNKCWTARGHRAQTCVKRHRTKSSVSCSSMSFEGLVETLDDVVNEPEGGYLFSSSHNETSFALLKALMYLQGKYHSEKYASTEHLSDKELEVRRKSEELYRKLSSEEGSEDALWWQYFDRGCRSGLHPTSELASCMLFLFREIGEPIQPWELSSDEEANAEEEVETEEPVIESPPPPQEQPRPPPERKDLERVTIAELKTMAKDLGLRGYSKLKKDQLVEALLLNLSP